MTRDEFRQKLAAELGIPPSKLADSVELSSLSAWDSMGRLAVVAMMDTDLEVDVPLGAMQRCKTVSDLVALMGDKITG